MGLHLHLIGDGSGEVGVDLDFLLRPQRFRLGILGALQVGQRLVALGADQGGDRQPDEQEDFPLPER